jgi:hypothetical protein
VAEEIRIAIVPSFPNPLKTTIIHPSPPSIIMTTNNNNNNNNNSNHEVFADNDDNDEDKELEMTARRVLPHQHHSLWLLLMNSYASFVMFFQDLITLESVVSVLLSVGSTIVLYYTTEGDEIHGGQALNWVLLSFAVVTPIASSIVMAFARRETALRSIGTVRATLLQLYVAHTIWDWGDDDPNGTGGSSSGGGRQAVVRRNEFDLAAHTDRVYDTIMALQYNLCQFLTLPSSTRARHWSTRHGRREAIQINQVGQFYYDRVVTQVVCLSACCESLKRAGLPGNEAARMRSWEHILLIEIEQLRNIKRYRTPQGLRSFGRLFSMFLPPFYAPYFTDLAHQLHSLGLGICFAMLTSIALTALFETVSSLEDPFLDQAHSVLDSIMVKDELITLFATTLSGRRRQLLTV